MDHPGQDPATLQLLKEKEDVMPTRRDYDGSRDSDNHARSIVGSIIVRVRAAIVRVKRMPVIVAVVAVVIDVFTVMRTVVVVGIRRRGHGQGGHSHEAENDFMGDFHFFVYAVLADSIQGGIYRRGANGARVNCDRKSRFPIQSDFGAPPHGAKRMGVRTEAEFAPTITPA